MTRILNQFWIQRGQILPLLLLAALLGDAARAAAAPQLVATPRAAPMPITPTNRPFLAASHSQLPVNLAARGYTEEELQISGHANVYAAQPGAALGVHTRQGAATPYTTRILLRRPTDAAKFSGRVVVELLSAAGQYDTAPLWGYSWDYFLRRGDAWVGVTVMPVAAKTLQRFDATRYAGLTFNYRHSEACAAAATPENLADAENGLAWDLIAQLGALLRSSSKENPLLNYDPQRVVLSGYAQTGGYVTTYAHAMHRSWRLGNGDPIFDAYVNALGTQAAPLNQCAPLPKMDDAQYASWQAEATPLVLVMTQSEPHRPVATATATSAELRRFEIAGAVHGGNFAAGQPAQADLTIAGASVPGALACRAPANNYPTKFVLNAIWQQLDERLVAGTAMTDSQLIASQDGQITVDPLGNAVGGWRMPVLDVPQAQYSAQNTAQAAASSARQSCQLVGSSKRLSTEQLKQRYGTRLAYLRQLDAAMQVAVRERRLLSQDAAELKSWMTTGLPQF